MRIWNHFNICEYLLRWFFSNLFFLFGNTLILEYAVIYFKNLFQAHAQAEKYPQISQFKYGKTINAYEVLKLHTLYTQYFKYENFNAKRQQQQFIKLLQSNQNFQIQIKFFVKFPENCNSKFYIWIWIGRTTGWVLKLKKVKGK